MAKEAIPDKMEEEVLVVQVDVEVHHIHGLQQLHIQREMEMEIMWQGIELTTTLTQEVCQEELESVVEMDTLIFILAKMEIEEILNTLLNTQMDHFPMLIGIT